MNGVNRINKGFLLTELMVALTVLGTLLACLALTLHHFRKFNEHQLARQRCIAAAQAELDSITVTGEAISQGDFERLWPRLSVSVEQSDGAGQWKGLKLVKVRAKDSSFKKSVTVELCRYILVKGEN